MADPNFDPTAYGATPVVSPPNSSGNSIPAPQSIPNQSQNGNGAFNPLDYGATPVASSQTQSGSQPSFLSGVIKGATGMDLGNSNGQTGILSGMAKPFEEIGAGIANKIYNTTGFGAPTNTGIMGNPIAPITSAKQAAGDVLEGASYAFPVGDLAEGLNIGGKAIGLSPKIAGATSKFLAPTIGYGYTNDVANNLQNNKSGTDIFTPGSGTTLVAALSALPYVGKVAGKMAGEATGATTGAGYGPIKEAFNAGMQGGEASNAFTGAMRNNVSPEQIITEARTGLDSVLQDRRTAYQQQLDQIAKNKTSLDITPINNQLQTQMDKFNIVPNKDSQNGLDFSRSTLRFNGPAQADITKIYNEMQGFGLKSGDRTAVGVDNLKQAFSDLYSDSSQARSFIESMRKTTRDVLSQVDGYDKLSSDYESSTKMIKELQQGLSLGKNASADTTFRKLAGALRQNNEFRQQLVKSLDDASGGYLSKTIAGQQLSSVAPLGLVKTLETAGGIGGLAFGGTAAIIPLIKAAVLSSPRLVGEFAHALGIGYRPFKAVMDVIGSGKGLTDMISEKNQKSLLPSQISRNVDTKIDNSISPPSPIHTKFNSENTPINKNNKISIPTSLPQNGMESQGNNLKGFITPKTAGAIAGATTLGAFGLNKLNKMGTMSYTRTEDSTPQTAQKPIVKIGEIADPKNPSKKVNVTINTFDSPEYKKYSPLIQSAENAVQKKLGINLPKGFISTVLAQESSMGTDTASYNPSIGKSAYLVGLTKGAEKELDKAGIKYNADTPAGAIQAAAMYAALRLQPKSYDSKRDLSSIDTNLQKQYTSNPGLFYAERYRATSDPKMKQYYQDLFNQKYQYYSSK